ncbi:MAG: RnfABCDGE type electron transport complex subunit B [Tissierellia bacterium]|nr:RnfABCDGE type electron transport complex subunit B [Tissierellia bacterium]
MQYIIPIVVLGALGLAFGLLLDFASRKFAVALDKKVVEVLDALPGANCGACGFPGCEGLANAIAKGEAAVNACPIGGQECADAIAQIMGVDAGEMTRNVAMVMCQGSCSKAKDKFKYEGIQDCRAMALVSDGQKACSYGCLGGASCVKVCDYDAIHVIDGVAIVDKEKCVACMKCIDICPKRIIDLVPYKARTAVACKSKDPGKVSRKVCTISCIACKLCERACKFDAIHVKNNLAKIDYEKCINCGQCVVACPTKAIFAEYREKAEERERKRKEREKKKKEEAKLKAEAEKAAAEKAAVKEDAEKSKDTQSKDVKDVKAKEVKTERTETKAPEKEKVN